MVMKLATLIKTFRTERWFRREYSTIPGQAAIPNSWSMQQCVYKWRDEQTKADTILLRKQVNDKIGIAESLYENKRQVLKNTNIGVGSPLWVHNK